jgi:protein required for attachment to host cells
LPREIGTRDEKRRAEEGEAGVTRVRKSDEREGTVPARESAMTEMTQGTWVLIADGEKALFLENLTDDADPNLHVWREDRHENPPDREQGTDRPGRHKDTGLSKQAAPGGLDWSPGQRSGFAETDWHRLEKERFAQELADRLYKYAHRGNSAGSSWSRRRRCWATFAASFTRRSPTGSSRRFPRR